MWYILRDKLVDSIERVPHTHAYPRGVLLGNTGRPLSGKISQFRTPRVQGLLLYTSNRVLLLHP